MATQKPSSVQVRHLLDEFLEAAPGAARSLVADTTQAIIDGLRRPQMSTEWLTSPAGVAAIGGGLALFGLGWLAGRGTRSSSRTALYVAAASSAGVAAGVLLRAGMAQTDLASPDGSGASDRDAAGA
jgi:hypothetical protein